MKMFFIKLGLFLLLLLSICILFSFFLPYHWGNRWYSTKIRYLESENFTEANVFFFGSSRIYRQIDPEIFDMHHFMEQAYLSYNLGAPALFCPQVYWLYENFLESDLSRSAEHVFIELMEVDLISNFLLHQERTYYWQNLAYLKFVIKSISNNQRINLKRKVRSSLNYFISYTEGKLFASRYVQKFLTKKNYYDEKYLGENKRGFFPLEQDLETTNDATTKQHLIERVEGLRNDIESLTNRASHSIEIHENNYEYSGYDNTHLDLILHLIESSENKGIHLIFILSPRNTSEDLVALSKQIPKKNLIDMSNAKKFPELFSLDNSFDIGHLNTQGSQEYSKLLAEQFVLIK